MSQTRLSAAERRSAILETATLVFSESGYRGATTAEIARRAGVSEPILYRHFGSKRDLYAACLESLWSQFEADARAAIDADRRGCLGEVSRAFLSSNARLRLTDMWAQALGEVEHDDEVAEILRTQIRRAHGFFVDAIRGAQEAGTILPDRDAQAEAWIWIAGGFLSTIDQKLGGVVGDDLERVGVQRRRWMTGVEPPGVTGRGIGRAPGCGTRGLYLVRRGATFVAARGYGSAAQPYPRALCHSVLALPLHRGLASGRCARWPHYRHGRKGRQVPRSSDFALCLLHPIFPGSMPLSRDCGGWDLAKS